MRTSSVAWARGLAVEASCWDTARSYEDIPGPKTLPVVGNAWRFMPYVGKYNDLGFDELVKTLHSEFGPVCKLSGMTRPDLLFVNDADTVQNVSEDTSKINVRNLRGVRGSPQCIFEILMRVRSG